MLFSANSIWTMIHGIALGGGALLGLAAALFSLRFSGASERDGAATHSRAVALLLVFVAAMLWLTVIGGTYIVFPPYRVAPPEGLVDLTDYPRSFLLSDSSTAWLHAYAMETKEHVPWMAAMLATAVAFVSTRSRSRALADPQLRGMVTNVTVIVFVLAAYVALLGVLVNKVAPLD